jgi:hypothetical protein
VLPSGLVESASHDQRDAHTPSYAVGNSGWDALNGVPYRFLIQLTADSSPVGDALFVFPVGDGLQAVPLTS